MSYIFDRKINYYETDKMGIVHHSNYIRFLEEARCAFLENCNMPYSLLENKKIMIPVLGVQCDFKHHVSFDDIISIEVSIKQCTGVRLTIGYIVTNKKTGNIVLTSETKHCFADDNLKPINLKKHFYDIYEIFANDIKIAD